MRTAVFFVLVVTSLNLHAREESIGEMSARLRAFCLQQPKQHRAHCYEQVSARVQMEAARRTADREEEQRKRRERLIK